MDLEDYFKGELRKLLDDYNFSNIIGQADKKACEDMVNRDCTLFQNSCVDTYNRMSYMVQDFRKTGVFAHSDNKELANATYAYYYVLKFVASHLDTEGTNYQFNYDKESIDKLIANFKNSMKDVYSYIQCKMNQD